MSKPRTASARCWRLFETAERRVRPATAWGIAVGFHLVAFGVAVLLKIEYTRQPVQYITLAPEPELPPFAGVRPGRGPNERAGTGRQRARPVLPNVPPETLATTTAPAAIMPIQPERRQPGFILGPAVGDGKLWVSPRPALPSDVADAIYEDHVARDSVIVRRLRAMVDSLNVIIDSEQRARRAPAWVARGANGKPVWGLDSSGIYVAGVKVPTPVLALLGSLLPPGNYDESVRQRKLADMRADIMQAATRAQNLEDFRRYVKELRQRNQEERDAERRQRGDTATAQP